MILHLITDRRRLAGPGSSWDAQRRCLRQQARFAAEAGIDVVQLRERDLDARQLLALTVDLLAVVRGSRTRVLVNDRVDVALAAGADGVHLRGDSMPAAAVRRITPPGFIIGRSVHTPGEVAAASAVVDYLVAGTIWPTASKPADHMLLGVDGLRAVIAAASVPVLAIGGVTLDRIPDLVHAAAHGFAAIGLFVAEPPSADSQEWCAAMPLHRVSERVARAAAAGGPAT